ncbi:MAG: hypothetical protein KAV87_03000 [Desulfobacteraceae bacterium]|nr:hypothetical protein [Desulfobacteraceae bacterium]
MKFISAEDNDFKSLWTRFLEEADNASWQYLSRWMDYQRIYTGSRLIRDLSFVAVDGEGPAAICPLFLELSDSKKQLSIAGGFQPVPMIYPRHHNKQRQKILAACFIEIDRLARENGAQKALFMVDPLAERYNHNILLQFGFLEASGCTAIIDLSKDLKFLWSRLRKSYKSLINSGKKTYDIIIMDSLCPDYSIHEAYRELHHKTAGRVTRPKATFDIMYKMVKEDNALLIGLKHGNAFVGFSYFLHTNGRAFYGSASDDPDFDVHVPMEHTVLWSAVKYYKERNFSLLEIGFQQFGSQLFEIPGPKEMNISFFKRGFGGDIMAVCRGIKYYDRAHLKEDLQARLENLIHKYEVR